MNVAEGLRIHKRGLRSRPCKHAIARPSSGSLNAHLVIHSWIVGNPEVGRRSRRLQRKRHSPTPSINQLHGSATW
jgi:hypothetical protein